MAPRFSREWIDYFIPETIAWQPDGMPDLADAVMKNLIGRSTRYPHGVPDAEVLHRAEGILSYSRMQELANRPIPGRFDLPHFQRIHHHLFQDIYPWAGQLRTAPRDWPMVKLGPDVAAVRAGGRHVTEIAHSYFKAREVPQAAAAVLDRIGDKNNLRGIGRGPFLDELTKVWARINTGGSPLFGDELLSRVVRNTRGTWGHCPPIILLAALSRSPRPAESVLSGHTSDVREQFPGPGSGCIRADEISSGGSIPDRL